MSEFAGSPVSSMMDTLSTNLKKTQLSFGKLMHPLDASAVGGAVISVVWQTVGAQGVRFQIHALSCRISLFEVPYIFLFISLFLLPWKTSCTFRTHEHLFFPKAQKCHVHFQTYVSDSSAVQWCQIQTCGLDALFNKSNLKLCKLYIMLTSAFIQLQIICTRLAPSWCKQGQLL